MLNKTITAMLVVSVFAYGCANTTANPVLVAQAGDDMKTCDGIANEMQQMVQARAVAEADRNKQIASNVALGVAGAFLIVPWFFMDTGNAATVEERAAQARYQRLNQMQMDRKCPAATPAVHPSPTIAAQPPGVVTPTTAVAKPESSAPTLAVAPAPVGLTSQSASSPVAVSRGETLAQSSQSVVKPKVGQDAWNVERLSEVKICASDPQAVLVAKGPGSETYTVACTDGNVLAVRCEFGTCRVLQ